MSELGLTGYNGTNPIELFAKGPHEGPHHPPREYFECDTCGFYSTTKRCTCPRSKELCTDIEKLMPAL
jgi:hypothetical protein